MKIIFLTTILLLNTIIFSQNIIINEFMSSNENTIVDEDGDYPDWVELYNNSDFPIDLSGYTISDESENIDKFLLPHVILKEHEYLLIFCSGKNKISTNEIHTNFKIKSSGEDIILCNNSKIKIDYIAPISLEKDQSYGREIDGSDSLVVFNNPTPNSTNNPEHSYSPISFSMPSGIYNNDFYLKLDCNDTIYYTTDGSTPDSNSRIYKDSILVSFKNTESISNIPTTFMEYDPDIWPNREFGFREPLEETNKAAIFLFQSYKNGKPSGKIYSKTYFTNGKSYEFPVFSIITDNSNLFDTVSGIYVPGIHLNENNLDWSGNYFQRGIEWEKTGNIDFFDENGSLRFSDKVGYRINGQKSRSAPQKSLRLYFRSEYGESKIDYPFFSERNFTEHKRLILRTPFTFWYGRNTFFQEDLIHKIANDKELNLESQMSSPSIVFINGEYWGIQNIRERQDQYYLNSLYGVDEDSVNIINGNLSVEIGSADDFIALADYIISNDMSVESNFEYVKTKLDIDNAQDYFIIETYFCNMDWPGNNLRLWKANKEYNKWRYLLYDLDATMADYTIDPFEHIKSSNSIQAEIILSLLDNEEFKNTFINKYICHIENSFNQDYISSLIEKYKDIYRPELNEHSLRWGNPTSEPDWNYICNILKDFVENRKYYIFDYLSFHFDYDQTKQTICNIGINDLEAKSNFIEISPNPSSGVFTLKVNDRNITSGNLQITNPSGLLVYEEELNSSIKNYNLSFLDNGVYYITLTSEDGDIKYTKKIVIIK